jgi:hypothetical protein
VSRNTVVVLIYHRHKLLDLTYSLRCCHVSIYLFIYLFIIIIIIIIIIIAHAI